MGKNIIGILNIMESGRKVFLSSKKGLAAVSASFVAALFSALGNYDVVHIHAEGFAFFAWLPRMQAVTELLLTEILDW